MSASFPPAATPVRIVDGRQGPIKPESPSFIGAGHPISVTRLNGNAAHADGALAVSSQIAVPFQLADRTDRSDAGGNSRTNLLIMLSDSRIIHPAGGRPKESAPVNAPPG